jgi:Spy/CpxP family protein refolding chaperone
MIKILGTTILAAVMIVSAAPAFAGGKAGCCMKQAAHEATMRCMNVDMAALNLTPDQKQKVEKWREECCNAGCTKESHAKFLKKAKGILSPEQYEKLKAAGEPGKKTEA